MVEIDGYNVNGLPLDKRPGVVLLEFLRGQSGRSDSAIGSDQTGRYAVFLVPPSSIRNEVTIDEDK